MFHPSSSLLSISIIFPIFATEMKPLTDTQYIRQLVSEGEHCHQDFKFEISDARKIARSLSAFANTEGGRLLVGVKDIGQRLFGGYAELLRIPHTARFSIGSVIACMPFPMVGMTITISVQHYYGNYSLAGALTAVQAHLAAGVDVPEEDVPELSQSHLCAVLGGVEQELDALIQSYDASAVLREGVDCAIVGRPNAGKSTLLNLLAGFDRAIVTPVAGTTRDVVEQAVQLGDVRLNLFDTAGLRQTEDAIEAEGIRRSWKKLEEAGLILAVFDGSERPTREDLELAKRCAGRPAIALVNKEDKPSQFDAEWIAPYFAMVLPVCCQEEGARKVIAAAVARLLGTSQIDPHAASLSGQRQLSAATRARDAVSGALDAAQGLGLDAVSVCVDDALDALCELTGENASEAVINEVFERFCVGK